VSFLATISQVRERRAIGFFARTVARHFEREGLVRILPVRFSQPVPPVGLITLRGRRRPPSAELLMECLRSVARRLRARG
jgi:DNA-binding transcriptional LysR family regulator